LERNREKGRAIRESIMREDLEGKEDAQSLRIVLTKLSLV